MRRAARWLTGAGVLLLPACAALDSEPPVGPPPPPRLTAPAAPRKSPLADTPVRQAGGEAEVIPAKATLALPGVPSAGTQGKPLPINLPTALTLTNASPLDVQIAD